MNSQLAGIFGQSVASGGSSGNGPASSDALTANNNGQFGTSGVGRFVSAQIGTTTEMIAGRLSLGTLLVLTLGSIAFYVWSRNAQGGG